MLGHVCLHQTVIGQECDRQIELAGEYPDVVIGCVGGGSNFAGVAFPFIREKLREGKDRGSSPPSPRHAPASTQGVYAYDFGDTVGMTPLMPMYTLGHDFVPPPVTPAACATTATRRGLARWSRRVVEAAGASSRPAAFDAAVRFAAPRASSPRRAVARDPRR